MEIEYYAELPSTQDKVKEILVRPRAKTPFAVCALRQTAGYGKQGRHFYSPAAGLYLTLALPVPEVANLGLVTLAVGCELAEWLNRRYQQQIRLKWVNDLYLDGKKLGGILTERRGEWLLVGFGLNFGTAAFPAELAPKAASLLPGAKLDQDLVKGACQAIEKAAVSAKNGAFLDRYRRLCFLQGRQVRVKLGHGELQGQCLDIDDQGRLLLNTPAGVKAVASGEVTKVDL